MNPRQIIEAQHDLLRRFRNDQFFSSMVAGTAEMGFLAGESENFKEWFKRTSANHIEAAYAYTVTPDMCALLEHAAAGLDDEDLWDPSLAPTGCGIVLFQKAVPVIDARGKTMLAHWAVWGPAALEIEGPLGGKSHESGTLVSLWNDLGIEPDEISREILEKHGDLMRARAGRWMPLGASITRPGAVLGSSRVSLGDDAAQRIESEGDTPTAFTNTDRYMHALWLMLGQTITSVREEPVIHKKARAAKFKGLPQSVTVIDLRRIEGASREPGETAVQWSHRWVVRGHWRWVPCGPGRSERRRVWIAPFVKGPEEAPLIVTDKIYALRR